jgi:hypothetical protein
MLIFMRKRDAGNARVIRIDGHLQARLEHTRQGMFFGIDFTTPD